MRKGVWVLAAVLVSFLLISPAWGESSDSVDLQALKEQLNELNKLIQSQQQQIQNQEKKLQDQEQKLQDQEWKLRELEQLTEEPVPYEDMDAIVEKVKAELPPPQDGLTIGGGKIRVTPYGFIRLDAAYDDSAQFMFSGNVVGWAWPEDGKSMPFPFVSADGVQNNADDDNNFSMTATATRLGLNFDGPEFAGGTIKGKIEVDFDELYQNGGDVVAHRIRMRHAYAELLYPTWSLLAGQSWDIIAPRIPNMLDCVVMWGSGNVGYRRPQLRLTKWWDVDGTKITGQASLNHTDRTLSDDFDKDLMLNGVESGWPMVEGRMGVDKQFDSGRKLSLGLSGLIAEEETDFSGPGENDDLDVWLVALDGSLGVVPGLVTVQGEIWTGENIDNVYGGIVQGFVSKRNALGVIVDQEEIEAYGGFIHAMITPRQNLQFNFGYGLDDVDSDDLPANSRSQNWTIFGNTIWTVVPNFDVGLELAWHETKWVGNADGDDFRIQSAFIYKF
ncbi:MAG: hypothetical protein C4532_03175 [Candidatus Abyssobacteria bacterium SURF_17]|jgi:hypothetical protein|uniref:Porin n=1 Tax=Candidatus Abyssobacteria bacterium SURF_17 TaxID=2093361 RepID=A0A419F6N8_9BACT|nr:MAG: hypothetical protein C4532_03175 [Candidatus Abyssubacteria bacterium SURF_17]